MTQFFKPSGPTIDRLWIGGLTAAAGAAADGQFGRRNAKRLGRGAGGAGSPRNLSGSGRQPHLAVSNALGRALLQQAAAGAWG